ncbi:hypothetical protein GS463_09210 [Rhodococcus hoagii]|nr:hypothetical protein [Prescottella equi]
MAELFAVLAYGEISAFYRLAEDARMAPTLQGRVALASMAAAEMGTSRRCTGRSRTGASSVRGHGPVRSCPGRLPRVDGPSTWLESLVKAYWVTASRPTSTSRSRTGSIHGGRDRPRGAGRSGPLGVRRAEVRAAVAASKSEKDRLMLWGRRRSDLHCGHLALTVHASRPAPRVFLLSLAVVDDLLAIILIAVLFTASIAMLWILTAASDLAAERERYVDIARATAINISTLRSDSAKEDLDKLFEGTTGPLRADLDARLEDFANVVSQLNVSTTGEVVEAGLESEDGNCKTSLVAVKANQKNADEAPVDKSFRLRVVICDEGGKLLASNVEFVP